MTEQLEGILPIWKPKGYTSHDVVAKVRRILKIKRIGHTGTLDPQVTGVLPLCIGRATRVVEYIQELPKEYEALLWLGLSTDTEDLSGTVLERIERAGEKLSIDQVKSVIAGFVGEIEQVPPMYSAVKVNGKRLYDLARQGVEVERKSRKVHIHRIDILDTDWSGEFPAVRFRVLCSKGTYIRTLCADIGQALEVPGVMAELTRTSTGSLSADQCLTLEQVEELQSQGLLADRLIPPLEVLHHLPLIRLEEEQIRRGLQGQKLRLNAAQAGELEKLSAEQQQAIAGVGPELNRFIGVFAWNQENRLLEPVKIFN